MSVHYTSTMINKQLLFNVIKNNEFTLREMAHILDLKPAEFKKKMELGIFQSNELEMMLHFLRFPCNPMKVFFDTYDWEDPKKIDWGKALSDYKRAKDELEHTKH